MESSLEIDDKGITFKSKKITVNQDKLLSKEQLEGLKQVGVQADELAKSMKRLKELFELKE